MQTVIFDIQDVGARFYTYIWTMYDAMIAAGQLGLRFVILDRPNPVGGRARGPLLVDGFTSGVGKDTIVQQHGMTAGEFARYANGVLLPAAGKTKVQRPRRDHGRGLADRRAVRRHRAAVDPAQPQHADAADRAALPGHLPVRGDQPVGGPRHHQAVRADRGPVRRLPLGRRPAPRRSCRACEFREAYFTPTFSKHVGVVCGGVQVHVTDPAKVDAIAVATQMMVALRDRYDAFAWRTGDNPPGRWIDLLTGSSRFRTQLDGGASAAEIMAAWKSELAEFDRRRRPYLLYRRSR